MVICMPSRYKGLDTIFVYGFKSWLPEYEQDKYGSAGVTAVWIGSTWFHMLLFYVCRCGSTRVSAGESGIRCKFTRVETSQNSLLLGLHSGKAVTHKWISNRVHTEYRPGSTRIDPHCNPCQFLMDSESMMQRMKKFWSCSNFLHGFRFRSSIRIDPFLTVLTRFYRIDPQCKTALTLVVYCIVLPAMCCDKVLHPDPYCSHS
jgi:hypothetical protein